MVLLVGFAVENDKDARAARIVRDIYRHTMRIIAGAEAVGGYDGSRFCSEQMRRREAFSEIVAGQITRQSQSRMTSSRVK